MGSSCRWRGDHRKVPAVKNGHAVLLLGQLTQKSGRNGKMAPTLRPFVARLSLLVVASTGLVPWPDPSLALAADKTAIEIVAGPKSMSPEEKAMAPDPARGSQHGIILVDESVRDESPGTESNIFRHVRAKIFSSEGRKLGDISIEHDRESGLLKKWWGFTVSPDGTVLEMKPGDLQEQELARTRG